MIEKNGFKIRALRTDDWQLFREVRLRALKSEPGKFGSNYQKELHYSEDEWKSWFDQYDRCTFGLFKDEKMIGVTGIVTSKEDPNNAALIASYIDKEYRRQGLSRLFYEARLRWAAAQPHLKKVLVSHRESNTSSGAANQAFGFIPIGRRSKDWPDGAKEDEILYELKTNDIRKAFNLE